MMRHDVILAIMAVVGLTAAQEASNPFPLPPAPAPQPVAEPENVPDKISDPAVPEASTPEGEGVSAPQNRQEAEPTPAPQTQPEDKQQAVQQVEPEKEKDVADKVSAPAVPEAPIPAAEGASAPQNRQEAEPTPAPQAQPEDKQQAVQQVEPEKEKDAADKVSASAVPEASTPEGEGASAPQNRQEAEPAPAPQAQQENEQQAVQQAEPKKEKDVTEAYRGIVKIEVANRIPDYGTPWNSGQFGRGTGTGFIVAPGLFMTNAHVVANAQRIYVSPYADARKIPAKVKYVAHDADLALVEVADAAAFKDVPYLEFSETMPKLEDEVRVIGYPIGGDRLSVTRGIVSRIDTLPYAHPQNKSHLIVQVDAAINHGNSGGPVLMDDKVVGVAFQGLMQANSTGYMIPLPVIRRFLKDVEDGRYDRYVEIGADFFPMQNPAMRRHYNLADDAMGTLVGDVVRGSSSDGKLKVGDLVVAVNGHAVDGSAMIELDGERVKLEEIVERSFRGDELTFRIIREGKEMEVKVCPEPLPANRITGREFDRMPRYVQFAGLVFQPLQVDVIGAHSLAPSNFIVEMDDYIRRGGALKKEDIVVMTNVLRDEVNAKFDSFGSGIVTKVNGVEVKGLRHLYNLLFPEGGKRESEFTVIEFKNAERPFVVENAALQAAHDRIRAMYNVPENAYLDENQNN